ncbi:MAG: hypothetical protein IJN96_01720 [Clostridia bacterium]|nr:hypothetical protein [Clostridia bacterium]
MSKTRKSSYVWFAGLISISGGIKILITKKALEGTPVFLIDSEEPFGKVEGISISKTNGLVDALIIETLSIIPIKRRVEISDIHKLTSKRIVLNRKYSAKKINFDSESVCEKDIVGIKNQKGQIKKIKDFRFDFETGEITDFIFKPTFFYKQETVPVKELKIQENKVYIKPIQE